MTTTHFRRTLDLQHLLTAMTSSSSSSQYPPPLLRRHTTRISSSQSIYALKSSVLAGYAAGCCGLIIGHPLDTMKVHLQTNSSSPLILKNVYNGIIPPLLTIGAVQSLNFAIYDNVRRYLFNNSQNQMTIRPTNDLQINYLTDDDLTSISFASLTAGTLGEYRDCVFSFYFIFKILTE